MKQLCDEALYRLVLHQRISNVTSFEIDSRGNFQKRGCKSSSARVILNQSLYRFAYLVLYVLYFAHNRPGHPFLFEFFILSTVIQLRELRAGTSEPSSCQNLHSQAFTLVFSGTLVNASPFTTLAVNQRLPRLFNPFPFPSRISILLSYTHILVAHGHKLCHEGCTSNR